MLSLVCRDFTRKVRSADGGKIFYGPSCHRWKKQDTNLKALPFFPVKPFDNKQYLAGTLKSPKLQQQSGSAKEKPFVQTWPWSAEGTSLPASCLCPEHQPWHLHSQPVQKRGWCIWQGQGLSLLGDRMVCAEQLQRSTDEQEQTVSNPGHSQQQPPPSSVILG